MATMSADVPTSLLYGTNCTIFLYRFNLFTFLFFSTFLHLTCLPIFFSEYTVYIMSADVFVFCIMSADVPTSLLYHFSVLQPVPF